MIYFLIIIKVLLLIVQICIYYAGFPPNPLEENANGAYKSIKTGQG